MIFDPAGNLYGATRFGPGGTCPDGCGTVFQLTPSESGWTENTLYSFQGGSDGTYALAGVISDPSGNLYGATSGQCGSCNGSVFMLAPSGGDWTFSSLHSFATGEGPADLAGMARGVDGSLYGTTYIGGAYGAGNVFKLTLGDHGWTYTSIYDFSAGNDGGYPTTGVTLDAHGNLYGTAQGGSDEAGVVWEITP